MAQPISTENHFPTPLSAELVSQSQSAPLSETSSTICSASENEQGYFSYISKVWETIIYYLSCKCFFSSSQPTGILHPNDPSFVPQLLEEVLHEIEEFSINDPHFTVFKEHFIEETRTKFSQIVPIPFSQNQNLEATPLPTRKALKHYFKDLDRVAISDAKKAELSAQLNIQKLVFGFLHFSELNPSAVPNIDENIATTTNDENVATNPMTLDIRESDIPTLLEGNVIDKKLNRAIKKLDSLQFSDDVFSQLHRDQCQIFQTFHQQLQNNETLTQQQIENAPANQAMNAHLNAMPEENTLKSHLIYFILIAQVQAWMKAKLEQVEASSIRRN